MKILNLIWEYRFILLCILAVIFYALFKWSDFKAEAYKLMLKAKKLAKDGVLGTSADQEEFVVNALYILLEKLKIPFITNILSKERIRLIVHKLYTKAMDYLDDGKINNSVQ